MRNRLWIVLTLIFVLSFGSLVFAESTNPTGQTIAATSTSFKMLRKRHHKHRKHRRHHKRRHRSGRKMMDNSNNKQNR